MTGCSHGDSILNVEPSARGGEECLAMGSPCVACDDSPNRHATAHFNATGHPIMEGVNPPEGWGWC